MNDLIVIRKKLGIAILPYTISAEELKLSFDWKLYHAYAYSREFLPVITGAGITSPVLGYLYTDTVPTSIPVAGMGLMGILCAVLLGVLRVRAGSEEVVKRILGQKKILTEFKRINNDISVALTETSQEAMPKLIKIQQEIIKLVNTGIHDEVWPFDGVKSGVMDRAKEKADRMLMDAHQEQFQQAIAHEQETPEQIS